MRKLKRKRRKRPKDHLLLKICVAAALCLWLSIWLKSRFVFIFAFCLWLGVLFAVVFLPLCTLAGRIRLLNVFGFWVALIVFTSLASLLLLFMNYYFGPRLWCRTNLSSLARAISLYSDQYNDTYPSCDKWCDLLIEHGNISKSVLKCRSARKSMLCDYAMNPNAEPSGASEMVLLFESKPGWNQYGGAEFLRLGKHAGIEGSSILFNDGHVEFVKRIDLGKLKWEDEQEQ
ncbi:MAG: hypothetical protein ACYSU3_22310 [Planctomycetota bacterium]